MPPWRGDHAAMGTGYILLALHLLGAAVWTGGHLVLALCILPGVLARRDVGALRAFEARYERLGLPALVLQAVTGLWLAARLLPDPADWLDLSDPLGRTILLKLVLLAATGLLGVQARLVLLPRLTPERLPRFAAQVAGVTVIGVAFVLVGASFRFGGV
jgi:putative copper export protein